MKFTITTSKIGKVIHKYLDNQDFISVEEDDSVFFFNNESDMFAQIRVDTDDGFCELNKDLVKEVSDFFSIPRDYSIHYISNWAIGKLELSYWSDSFSPIDYYRSDMVLKKNRKK